MIPITFIEPKETQDQQKERSELVTKMTELIEYIEKKGRKLVTMTGRDRQNFVAMGFPELLVDNAVYLTQRVETERMGKPVEDDQMVVGFNEQAFDPNHYAGDAVGRCLDQPDTALYGTANVPQVIT